MLKQFMEDNNLTQQKAAELLGVSQGFISQVLLGKKKLSKLIERRIKRLQSPNNLITYNVHKGTMLDKFFSLLIANEVKLDNRAYKDIRSYIHSI
jgi:transcriptional regulator with XRE-family HTH domain